VSQRNSEWHPDSASYATTAASNYSAEKPSGKRLKALVGTDDRPSVPRHNADLQSPLLLGRAPVQASPQGADVSRIANRSLNHEGQHFEIFRAYFLWNFDLADDFRGRTQKDIFPDTLTHRRR
jgi:hypothetical protein